MDNRKVGKLIAELRNKKGMTQQELGDIIGVGFRAVSKWECGQTLPDISNLKELSRIFNITLDELIAGKLKIDKKKLSTKYKIITSISSLLLIIIISILTSFNIQDKTYVYNLTSIKEQECTVEGQITFTKADISIVINKLIFHNDSASSTKITNYEYQLFSGNQQLLGYGYSPFSMLTDDFMTIETFYENFQINSTTEIIVSHDEFINNDLYLNINFLNENNEIINYHIKIKALLID